MSNLDSMLAEFHQEAATTRRVLDRVPADKLAWKPHAKSMSLGQLALHIATVPAGICHITEADVFDVSQSNFAAPAPQTMDEVHAVARCHPSHRGRDAIRMLRRQRPGQLALDVWRPGADEHTASPGLALPDVEPLVPPSRSALRLSSPPGCSCTLDLWSQR